VGEGERVADRGCPTIQPSLPGLTRQSILLRKCQLSLATKMDPRVKPAGDDAEEDRRRAPVFSFLSPGTSPAASKRRHYVIDAFSGARSAKVAAGFASERAPLLKLARFPGG